MARKKSLHKLQIDSSPRAQSSALHAPSRRVPLFEVLETRVMLSANSHDDGLHPPDIHDLGRSEMWANQSQYQQFADTSADFQAFVPWPDFDPIQDGFQLTYSYSNLLSTSDPLPGGLSADTLRAATEEALGLWAEYAPLHFTEVADAGPPPSTFGTSYPFDVNLPHIRIGHGGIDGSGSILAQAYLPQPTPTGLAGDVQFDSGDTWIIGNGIGFDVLEVMLHELGHSLGMLHEVVNPAIMNPFYGGRFDGLGTGFLLQDDINGIRSLYGTGTGSVTPLTPLVVDTLVDENDGDLSEGDVSLREAIQIIASGQENVARIAFAEDLSGTITLDPALSSIQISRNMSIIGPGADVITIAATDPSSEIVGDGFRIFEVTDSLSETNLNVTISGLTLENADVTGNGGAILNDENLSLDDVVIKNNSSTQRGGAVYSTGSIAISGSTIENNYAGDDGGGLYTNAGVSLDASTFYKNQAGDEGGAIAAWGTNTRIELHSSTISGNTSEGDGGGIHVLDPNPIKFNFLHSTLANNVAGGTGGGVYMYNGVLVIDHTIVASNSDQGTAPDIDNLNFFAFPAVLSKFSLVGSNVGSSITDLQDSLIGTPGASIDPMLQELAYNGGPTQTHKPDVDSPVIDSGDPNIAPAPATDQRGAPFERILFNAIDIGAIEFEGPGDLFIVTTLTDENDGNYAEADLSLREALFRAGEQPGPSRIIFDLALNGQVLNLDPTLGALVVDSEVTIDAMGLSAGLTINASTTDATPELHNGDGSRVFMIDDGLAAHTTVRLLGLALQGGDVTGNGGAIYSKENLALWHVSVSDSAASEKGGGIYHLDGSLRIENSAIYNNESIGNGGGLHSNTSLSGTETGLISNSTFSGNIAGDEGGGIFNFDGFLSLEHVTVTQNSALSGGGMVSFGDGFTKTEVYSSIISGNSGQDIQRSRNTALNSFESKYYNLIGSGNAIFAFDNDLDLIDVLDPVLADLDANGGRTMTHAIKDGSPAIDASDPLFIVSESFDQRGAPFYRVEDGDLDDSSVLDIGAFELPFRIPDTDFNGDGVTTGLDFMAWMRGFGTTSGATNEQGDTNRDGDVDKYDFQNWWNDYGKRLILPVSSAVSSTSIAQIPAMEAEAQSALAGEIMSSSPTGTGSTLLSLNSSPIPPKTESSVSALPEATLQPSIESFQTTTFSEPTPRSPSGFELSSLAARMGLFSVWGEDELDKDFDSIFIPELSSIMDNQPVSRKLPPVWAGPTWTSGETELESHGKASSVDLALEKLDDLRFRGLNSFE